MSVRRVLIANRGEIAVRIVRACRKAGVETVLACSAADRGSHAATMADRVVCVGPAPAVHSYLDQEAIVTAAIGTGCDALHPGYGFLSESPDFAAAVEAMGIGFVGPDARTIAKMGDKAAARIEAMAGEEHHVLAREAAGDERRRRRSERRVDRHVTAVRELGHVVEAAASDDPDGCGHANVVSSVCCGAGRAGVNPRYARSCRAITIRWISLVPSPMVRSLTSRKYFSAG